MRLFNRLFVLATMLLLLLVIVASQVAFAAVSRPAKAGMAAPEAPNATELLVFGVNRAVTRSDRGFPRDDPPMASANGNWFTPVNFAEGTFYYRVQVRSQPQAQNMKIQFCAWQDQFVLESCGNTANVSGNAGTVVTWSQPVDEIWKKDNVGIDWRRPRQRYGIAIKNSQSLPVSDYLGWNWNGENPDHWYPLDTCISVVVVAKGATFSGWQNYSCGGGGNPTATATPVGPTATRTPTPVGPTPTPTWTPTPTGGTCTPTAGNLVQNPGFENNLADWRFHSRNIGSWRTADGAYECDKALQIQINQSANNTQLYQTGVALEANTRYRLRFAAYAGRGQDMGIYLHKHGTPYTNYGLAVHQVNLQPGWQLYTAEFTTSGFSGLVTDGRLRFWLAPFGQPGDEYWIDAISLVKLSNAVTTADAPNEPVVVTLPDLSMLIGLSEAEFDYHLVDLINDGNVVEQAEEQHQIFLPAILN